MRFLWGMIIVPVLLLTMLSAGADGASVNVTLEDDEFTISVDPTDELQGYLEIAGEVDVSVTNILESISVTLSVDIMEKKAEEPTGRYWLGDASFDSGAVGGATKVFRKGDAPAPFKILISPELYDPATDEAIPVPAGLALDVEGALTLKAVYSGAEEGERTVQATIYPEPYHLLNLSTPTGALDVTAGHLLNYTLRVKNAGNLEENAVIEVPVLAELQEDGWETYIQSTGQNGLAPGEEFTSILELKAPNVIEEDITVALVLKAFTEEEDPGTSEPWSMSELSIELHLKESSVVVDDDDDTDTDDTDDDGTDGVVVSSPVVAAFVVGIVVAIIVVLIIIFIKKGKGGNDGDEDPHSSMFRI